MPFTAWKQEERNIHRDQKTYLLHMTLGGFVIELKSFQNKKGQKNLRYLTKKQK